MKNYWQIYNNTLAYWYVIFPKSLVQKNPSLLFNFSEGFCELLAKYQIFQLEKIYNELGVWEVTMSSSYPQYLREAYELTGKIPFFYHQITKETPTKDRIMHAPSKICFFREGNLVQDNVNDLGELLYENNETINLRRHPVFIEGNLIEPEKIDLTNEWQTEPHLRIGIFTDIWFPYVFKYNESGFRVPGKFQSNQEIANCHTPNFNAWLNELKNLGSQWSGEWEYVPDGSYPLSSDDNAIWY